MKIELSSCGSKYYKKMQLDAMLITSLRDTIKYMFTRKMNIAFLSTYVCFFLLKQREKNLIG